ncbi:hypothetical protein M0R45_031250 [Rubus argutus]|uniref:Uncharacterized protein n=1 Tax=Rubus argutus TaxID=59490 RepID=A0AAW1WFW6_RUBAR
MASLLSFSLPNSKMIRASSPSTSSANDKNGSSLKLQIPNAHVTSYKPKVYWKDDGVEEVLYTIPGKGTDSSKAKGGIGLVLNDVSEAGSKGSLLSTSEWTVKDVDSDSIDAMQKYMMSRVYAAPPKERLKAIYNTPPSKYDTLDQGRELFFRVIRMGFEGHLLIQPWFFVPEIWERVIEHDNL